MKTISAKQLEIAGACEDQVGLFRSEWGDEAVPLTKANWDRAGAIGLDRLWMRRFLSYAAQAEFDKVRYAARAECDKMRVAALDDYCKACAAALDAYDKACAAARAEYDKVCAPALFTALTGEGK